MELLILRLIHILGGIFWVGSILFTTIFLVPALASSGASAGQVMGALKQRGMMTYIPVVALLTIASGARLLSIASGGLWSVYLDTATGRTLAIGGAVAIVAFLLAFTVMRPAIMRSAHLGAALASAPEQERAELARELTALQRRSAVASTVAAVLLALSAATMAVARYL